MWRLSLRAGAAGPSLRRTREAASACPRRSPPSGHSGTCVRTRTEGLVSSTTAAVLPLEAGRGQLRAQVDVVVADDEHALAPGRRAGPRVV